MIVREVQIGIHTGHIEVAVDGFRRLLSVYGRKINDSNWNEPAYYFSYLCDVNDSSLTKVPFLFAANEHEVPPDYRFLTTIVLDEGRHVKHVFQPPFCHTGLMR